MPQIIFFLLTFPNFFIAIFVIVFGNSEEWWLLHIKVATAIVVLAILLVILLVKVCKCERNSENQSEIELQPTSYELTEAVA